MLDALQFEFMRNAVLAGILASVACGIVGSYVVVKRIVFISGGISHAAFGGIGLAYWLGLNPLLGAAVFSVVSAVGIELITKRLKQREDTSIGILWSVGMALGIIFISLKSGYAPDLFSYLFGSILTVPLSDVTLIIILDAIIVLTVLALYKEFLALTFDEEFATIMGVNVEALYLILLGLIALTVVVLIKVVGVILVIALLTIPAAISSQHTNNLSTMMLLSILLGIIFTFSGLWLSYTFNLASGATIILVASCVFFLSSFYKHLTRTAYSS